MTLVTAFYPMLPTRRQQQQDEEGGAAEPEVSWEDQLRQWVSSACEEKRAGHPVVGGAGWSDI